MGSSRHGVRIRTAAGAHAFCDRAQREHGHGVECARIARNAAVVQLHAALAALDRGNVARAKGHIEALQAFWGFEALTMWMPAP